MLLRRTASQAQIVAPRAGAWIEMTRSLEGAAHDCVAPRAGAWIEITVNGYLIVRKKPSLPVRERGLKYDLTKKV